MKNTDTVHVGSLARVNLREGCWLETEQSVSVGDDEISQPLGRVQANELLVILGTGSVDSVRGYCMPHIRWIRVLTTGGLVGLVADRFINEVTQ